MYFLIDRTNVQSSACEITQVLIIESLRRIPMTKLAYVHTKTAVFIDSPGGIVCAFSPNQ